MEVRHRHRLHHLSRVAVAVGIVQRLGMASQNRGQGSRSHTRSSSKRQQLLQQHQVQKHQVWLQQEQAQLAMDPLRGPGQ